MDVSLSSLMIVGGLALVCQYVAVSTGAGYGTPLTPLLLIVGLHPLHIVPAVLLSQLVGGVVGGIAHHRAGNLDLDFRRDEQIKKRLRGLGYLPRSFDSKVVFALTILGIAGVLIGVVVAVSVSEIVLQTYIGVLILAVGLKSILERTRTPVFSWKTLLALGIVGAFNKGMSGAGYVPVITGGQLVSGREVKNSVASTTVTVAIVCAAGFLGYLFINGNIDWAISAAATVGAVVAAPFGALTVKKANTGSLKLAIGIAIMILGALTLIKTFVL